MKIGFNIDETLNDMRYTVIRIFNRELNRNVSNRAVEKNKQYYVYESFGLTIAEATVLWEKIKKEAYKSSIALPHSIETLRKISEKGHEVYYLTSRDNKDREETIGWIKKHHFPFKNENLFMGLNKFGKINTIKKLGIELYIEDEPEVIEELKKEKIAFVIKNQSYNQHFAYERIFSWTDLIEIVEKVNK